jgi:hypothetical protein
MLKSLKQLVVFVLMGSGERVEWVEEGGHLKWSHGSNVETAMCPARRGLFKFSRDEVQICMQLACLTPRDDFGIAGGVLDHCRPPHLAHALARDFSISQNYCTGRMKSRLVRVMPVSKMAGMASLGRH